MGLTSPSSPVLPGRLFSIIFSPCCCLHFVLTSSAAFPVTSQQPECLLIWSVFQPYLYQSRRVEESSSFPVALQGPDPWGGWSHQLLISAFTGVWVSCRWFFCQEHWGQIETFLFSGLHVNRFSTCLEMIACHVSFQAVIEFTQSPCKESSCSNLIAVVCEHGKRIRGAFSRAPDWECFAEAIGLVSICTSVNWDCDSLWYHREKLFWNYRGRSSRAVAADVEQTDCIGWEMRNPREQENWVGFLHLPGKLGASGSSTACSSSQQIPAHLAAASCGWISEQILKT